MGKTDIRKKLRKISLRKGRQEDIAGDMFYTHQLPHLVDVPRYDDRSCVIVFTSLLEQHLQSAISSFFAVSEDQADPLFDFEKGGPLATFAAKVKIAVALGFVNPDMKIDLDLVRLIRNTFAHSSTLVSFSDPEIAEACDQLKHPVIAEGPYGQVSIWPLAAAAPRDKFLATVAAITEYFLHVNAKVHALEDILVNARTPYPTAGQTRNALTAALEAMAQLK
jgi:hypothetical protein